MTDEWAGEKGASGRVRDSGGQTGMRAEREVKRSRRRKGVKAKPNTCSTSPRSIRAAQRRAEALDLRVQGYTFEVIGKHLGVSKAQAARDIDTALSEITAEPARELLKLELRRLDELTAAHYADALAGDVTATNTILRVMAHRAVLMGWSRDQPARVVISDGGGAGGEPRRLELEFVLPGKRIADMDGLDAISPPCSRPSSPSLSSLPSSSSPSSRTMDLKANPPSSGVPIMPMSRKPTDWMG
jgi:hypothetical protein